MKLCLINHSYKYELEKLIRIFSPFEKIEFCEGEEREDRTSITSLLRGEKETRLSAELLIDNKSFEFSETLSNDNPDYDNECERLLAVAAMFPNGEYLQESAPQSFSPDFLPITARLWQKIGLKRGLW